MDICHLSNIEFVGYYCCYCLINYLFVVFVLCCIFAERELSYKLVVVGGGAGGCGTANKFANKLGKDQVISDTAVVMVTILSLLLF